MTTVTAQARRDVGSDSFADLTGGATARVVARGAYVEVTFDADLTAEQVENIEWRMRSRDDVHEARLRALAGLHAAVDSDPSLENVAALSMALAEETLGEVP